MTRVKAILRGYHYATRCKSLPGLYQRAYTPAPKKNESHCWRHHQSPWVNESPVRRYGIRPNAQAGKALEEHWRTRMREARAVYLRACEQRKSMTEEVNQDLFAPVDGSFALAKVARAEAWALHQLERTTSIYADLVRNGKSPPQDVDEELLL